jgi:hypothetical protein
MEAEEGQERIKVVADVLRQEALAAGVIGGNAGDI